MYNPSRSADRLWNKTNVRKNAWNTLRKGLYNGGRQGNLDNNDRGEGMYHMVVLIRYDAGGAFSYFDVGGLPISE